MRLKNVLFVTFFFSFLPDNSLVSAVTTRLQPFVLALLNNGPVSIPHGLCSGFGINIVIAWLLAHIDVFTFPLFLCVFS